MTALSRDVEGYNPRRLCIGVPEVMAIDAQGLNVCRIVVRPILVAFMRCACNRFVPPQASQASDLPMFPRLGVVSLPAATTLFESWRKKASRIGACRTPSNLPTCHHSSACALSDSQHIEHRFSWVGVGTLGIAYNFLFERFGNVGAH